MVMTAPRLVYRPADPVTPFQWHAPDLVQCPITGKASSYLAGLRSYERAVSYGHRNGWQAPGKEHLTGGGVA